MNKMQVFREAVKKFGFTQYADNKIKAYLTKHDVPPMTANMFNVYKTTIRKEMTEGKARVAAFAPVTAISSPIPAAEQTKPLNMRTMTTVLDYVQGVGGLESAIKTLDCYCELQRKYDFDISPVEMLRYLKLFQDV